MLINILNVYFQMLVIFAVDRERICKGKIRPKVSLGLTLLVKGNGFTAFSG